MNWWISLLPRTHHILHDSNPNGLDFLTYVSPNQPIMPLDLPVKKVLILSAPLLLLMSLLFLIYAKYIDISSHSNCIPLMLMYQGLRVLLSIPPGLPEVSQADSRSQAVTTRTAQCVFIIIHLIVVHS
jgi:hypothetical protein